ncbi:MAG: PEGA domain-containing protein [Deltaproteobacteria bacterium]|nr:PEGA domain-containing protein [Deltaproteobacteria bacterium]
MLLKRFNHILLSGAALGIILSTALTAQAADLTFGVMPVVFDGDLTPAVKSICTQRLALGLKATGAIVKDGPRVTKLMPTEGACDDVCRQKIAAALQAQYIVGATVKGEDRFYELHLWLADAESGKASVQVKRTCHVCSLTALARSMDLAASALRAKVKTERAVPGDVTVETAPAAAMLEVDGQPMGQTPTKLKLLPGKHEIVAKLEGYLAARKTLTVIAGSEETVTLNLVAEAKARRSKVRPILGWTGIALGAASMVTGIVLMVMDGEGTCESAWPGEDCPERLNTLPLGAAFFGTGAALSGVGAYLLLSESVTKVARSDSRRLSLVPLRQGVGLSFWGSF